MAKSKGGLSLSNKRYINKNYTSKTAPEIAADLKKPVELIINYIKIELGSNPIPDDTNRSATQEVDQSVNLRSRPEWFQLVEQYTPKELNIFEEKYHKYMKQFQYDVQPTEEQQIFHMIGLEIEMDRNKISRKRNLDLKEQRLKYIAQEERKDEKERSKGDIIAWQNDVLALESATSNSMKELKDLLDRHEKLAVQLKGTRDQRIKDSTSSKISWVEVIKYWSDPANRAWEAKRLAVINEAIASENLRLGSYHTFSDGKIDRPILNVETNGEKENTAAI